MWRGRVEARTGKPCAADVYLVGLGLFGMCQVTLETLQVLEQSRTIFHLTARHSQLSAINPNTQDLGWLYSRPGRDTDIYAELARYVVNAAKEASPVVLALDGNPMFFSDISWNIAAIGKIEGLRVEALPAVSCIDVLPMQLGFEAGDLGLQIFEARQLVLYDLSLNPYLSTLVLQVGDFGEASLLRPAKKKRGVFAPLVLHLCKFFPPGHPAIFIESATSSDARGVVFSTEVGLIEDYREEINSGATLYLPRLGIPTIDEAFRKYLGSLS